MLIVNSAAIRWTQAYASLILCFSIEKRWELFCPILSFLEEMVMLPRPSPKLHSTFFSPTLFFVPFYLSGPNVGRVSGVGPFLTRPWVVPTNGSNSGPGVRLVPKVDPGLILIRPSGLADPQARSRELPVFFPRSCLKISKLVFFPQFFSPKTFLGPSLTPINLSFFITA